MPRDANGNYTLPLPPVITGTTIDVAWANPTMADLATSMSNSLSRTGSGGMLAPLKLIDGVGGAPAMTWNNEPNAGLYRKASGVMAFSVAGQDIFTITAAGIQFSTDLRILISDGNTGNQAVNANDLSTPKLADGTALLPSLSFLNEVDSGMWLEPGVYVGFSFGGVEKLQIGAGGPAIAGDPLITESDSIAFAIALG